MITLCPGDVVLTAGNTILGKFIRWGECVQGEKPSRVNHAAMVVESPDIIVEAAAIVRRVSLLQYHANDGILVYRPLNLTQEQRHVLINVIESKVGQTYPVKQLFAYLIDNKIFRGRTVVRWLLALKPEGVCSRIVRLAFAAIGLDFGVPEPDPDDMDDFCRSNPDKYELVYGQNIVDK